MAIDVVLPAAQAHRFSLEEYHQLIESGGFDEDSRVELIEGVIVDMSPKTAEHENAITWLMRWLISPQFEKVPLGAYQAGAFWITAVLFASEHGPYWDVGLVAGVAYNWWMVRTRSLAFNQRNEVVMRSTVNFLAPVRPTA